MKNVQELLDAYVTALRGAAADANESPERSLYLERLAAADDMAQAIALGDDSRLTETLSQEDRMLGWMHLSGPAAAIVNGRFNALRTAQLDSRLDGRPSAR